MSPRPTVFVARRIPTIGLDLIAPHAQIVLHEGAMPPTRSELLAGVRGCAGILSLLSDRIDAEVLESAGPQLKVISNLAVGYNNIDVAQATQRGVQVGNTPDVLTDATADIAVALLLATARQFPAAITAARTGQWRTWEPLGWLGQDLTGKTLGIVGMGRIGQAVARRLQAGWNMPVLYTARTPKPDLALSLAAAHVSLDQLLSESDFISLHVPLTSETRGLISTAQLQRMKPSAILINTARGEIVDQEALVSALQQGQILAAGLDVCTPEPLPLDHPLFHLPNCLLLPHIGSATIGTRDAMAERAARNIVAGLMGEALPFPVRG